MKKFGNFNIIALVIGFSFLYIPIILLILFSFNESRLVTVWGGFSTKWYGELMNNQGIKDAAWVTIKVAFISSTVATLLGTIAGLVMTRFGNFRGRTLFSGMIYAPMVMPEKSVLPLKLPKRVITSPAIVPNNVATVEDIKATLKVTQAASLMPWFCISSTYHFVENPAQTVTNLDSLKLNKIKRMIGK
jgi:ABC-type glycerol-3-phosphate transport system permease component